MDDPILFQATKRYKIRYVLAWPGGLILSTLLLLLVLAQNLHEPPKVIFIVIGAIPLPLITASLSFWVPPRKLRIFLEADKISGPNGNQYFQISFSEILHIENLGYALRIDATNSQLLLQKRHFDLEQIQVELKKRLHPDVFIDGGWVNLPAYQPIKEQQNALLTEISGKLPLRINQEIPVIFKVLLVICIGLSLAGAFLSWQQLGFGSLWFLLFALLCGTPLIHKGVLEVDNHQISYETRFRKYRILWDDVVRVEHDDALSLAFYGQNQCLRTSINSDFKWGKDQKGEFFFFLHHIIEQKNIDQRRSQWASFRFNKNTRVPK